MIPFDDIRTCDLEERDACGVERILLETAIEEIVEKLATLEAKKENIIVFDIFDAVCPATQKYRYPGNGIAYLYRDKDHFNALGSMLLAEPLVELLRESDVLTPD